jgi:hypothetical protein
VTTQRGARSLRLYAAKCYWPGVTASDLEEAVGQIDGHLGSLLFPDDDLVLVLLESRSIGEVWNATEDAGIPCERVMASRWVAPSNERNPRPASSA